ncbi:ECF-type sigma factor [Tahibacter amnicola]|uniref:ECF-type sigma factor n=1 Tax=Tahibacter amnicola TaxID=2976241 RepID=A0ABY6B9N3_9GAMM|nr:ECF-type sigma factor [Tahibacter amnicola]UXI66497.1 ECF-type sigma factor [Tahibacter amnicola]
MGQTDSDTTVLLAQWNDGSAAAGDALLKRFYDELRKLAAAQLGREWGGKTLQATELVHEAWFRLCGDQQPSFANRRHFFGSAARAMRQALIDRARGRQAEKRGGSAEKIQLDEILELSGNPDVDLLELDNALRQLELLDERQVQIVELRYFLGLSIEQTGEALGLHPSTVNRQWESARAWLLRTLSP